MKNALLTLFLLLCFSVTAQNYGEQWKIVTGFEQDGRVKSAAEEVDKIYTLAKKDKNEPQIIKAFLFRSRYILALEENAQSEIINALRKEKKNLSIPSNALLESIYAEILSDFFEGNRGKIYANTHVKDLPDDNFLTWSISNFNREIHDAYKKSLESGDILYKIPLVKYEAVIELHPLLKQTNRSLYDFLAERYINHKFNNSGSYYNVNYSPMLKNTPDFLQYKFSDSINADLNQKVIFQQKLEAFYISKKDTASLYRSILRRLDFVENNISYRDTETYINTLKELTQTWQGPFLYEAKLRLAQLYGKEADKTIHNDYLIKAVDLCNDIIANARYTDAAIPAANLKNNIVTQKLNISTPEYIIPNRPSLAKVLFKNITEFDIAFYKINIADVKKLSFNNNDSILKFISKSKPENITKYSLPYPEKGNFFEYTTEIVLPALEKGFYIMAINQKSINSETYSHDFDLVQVTGIAITQQQRENMIHYQATDRATGKPLKDAGISIDGNILKTDKNGKVVFNIPKKAKNSRIKPDIITFKKDTLYPEHLYGYYYNGSNYVKGEEEENFTASAILFLDRAIYRPGQTVYYKGILHQYKKKVRTVVPNVYVTVIAYDSKNNEIKNFRLKTNEFGSFSGEFTIPKDVLTGKFTLSVEEDEDYKTDENYNTVKDEHPFWDYADFEDKEIDFQVEEYKRPTFEISFNPVNENLKLNDTIKITGFAKAFSGAPIANAKVSYTISYNIRAIKPHGNYKYDSDELEGTAITDSEGNFTLEFFTEAEDYLKEEMPIGEYHIQLEITDPAGEMRSGNFLVYAANHSLELSASIPYQVSTKKKNTISIDSQNINGQQTTIKGEIKIYKLKNTVKELTVKRPWPAPEIQTLPEKEFKKLFPYYPYTQEAEDKPERQEIVFRQTVDTETTKEISLTDFTGWKEGRYELVFTAKDPMSNTEVESTQYFEFSTDKLIVANTIFSYKIVNSAYNKDKYIELQLSTALPEIYLNAQSNYDGNYIFDKIITLKKGISTIKIPVPKDAEGDIAIQFDYFFENNLFQNNFHINTGTTKTDKIDLDVISMNNRLVPGNNETWSFKVLNKDKQAEVLASMYDMSLDDFASEEWRGANPSSDYVYSHIDYKNAIEGGICSISITDLPYASSYQLQEDRLNLYGLDINSIKFVPVAIKISDAEESVILVNGGFIVTGIVADNAGPLPGASVFVKGSRRATQTDMDGIFNIAVNKDEIIEISYLGFNPENIQISGPSIGTILLKEDGTDLQNVVVDRYRSVTLAKTAAAVTTLSIEYIEDRTNASILQSLQGQVAGLNIATGSGNPGDSTIILRGVGTINGNKEPLFIVDGIPVDEDGFRSINQNDIASFSILKDAAATSIYGNRGANGVIVINTKSGLQKEKEELQKVQARKNLQETAFFYPQLLTDKKGAVSFSFTSPEALTQWKLRLFAHDKEAVTGYIERIAVTQKDLMILPNMPRFFREGDTIVIMAKINNMTPETKTGNAMLELYDASTGESIDALSQNSDTMKPFILEAKSSTTASWKIRIPEGIEGIQYKIVAKSGNFTDGEESIIPVLSNRILVTESIPVWVKPNTSKEYTLENLKNNNSSTTKNHKLVFEYTSNPAWIALQSLPYLMEYEYNCSEQIFSRYYANAIAAHVLNSNPKIAEVFEAWRKAGKPVSKLEQNEELKTLIASESPWMLEAKNEEENKSRLALLFELERMKTSMEDNLKQLDNRQHNNGAFSWFEGGDENEFITRHILAGFGHLQKMNIAPDKDGTVKAIIKSGVKYLDLNYNKKYKETDKIYGLGSLHHLYTRSFFTEQYPVNDSLMKKMQKQLDHSEKNWLSYSLYQKAMAALVLHRFGEGAAAKKILVSLKETATNNPEWGMYWKENKPGYYWHNSPIETQALLIEAFTEIGNDIQSADAMKVWLIKNKQNTHWPTTKSTTEATYALLMKGSEWLPVQDDTTIKLGNEKALAEKMQKTGKEAGTGYIKLEWNGNEISKELATVTIENKATVPGYGGFFWQYFDDIDKIKPAEQGLIILTKEYLIKRNTSNGINYIPVTSENDLKIGDVVTIHLTLLVKEDLEYVHLKDLRASAFEPVDVLSGYKRTGGLYYYKSTRDASTNFFFDKINKGTYTLEYEVKVNNSGNFSGGISTMQSMYAPEFLGNSGGSDRIKVNPQ